MKKQISTMKKTMFSLTPNEINGLRTESLNFQKLLKQKGIYKKIPREKELSGWVSKVVVSKVLKNLGIPHTENFRTIHREGEDIILPTNTIEIKSMNSSKDFTDSNIFGLNYWYIFNHKRDNIFPIEMFKESSLDKLLLLVITSKTLGSANLDTSCFITKPITPRQALNEGIVKIVEKDGHKVARIIDISKYEKWIYSQDGYDFLKENFGGKKNE